VKVIAGILKGRNVAVPKGRKIRPTGGRVKEALFSLIGDSLDEAQVLDLFCGTGNIGIEALSRGALCCTFVERNRKTTEILRKNLRDLGLTDRSTIIPEDVKRGLKILEKEGKVFDIVFLDPPYSRLGLGELLFTISSRVLLKENGVVILEHESRRNFDSTYGNLKLVKEKRYGNTTISIFQKE
jgi:16S rRNA (guanine(966)-N(2))-methyltransferase RsmD